MHFYAIFFQKSEKLLNSSKLLINVFYLKEIELIFASFEKKIRKIKQWFIYINKQYLKKISNILQLMPQIF